MKMPAMVSAAVGAAIIAIVLAVGLVGGAGAEGVSGVGAIGVLAWVAVGLAFIGGGVAMRARARGAARAATGYTSLRWVHHDGPEHEAPFVVDVKHGDDSVG